MLFCHKYSIVNLHIDVFKNWMTHYLFGKAFLAWLSGWPRLINIKTGTRRITRPYELSSVVLPSRRATKDYSSSRIMHLVPVAILEKKNRTNCFVCLLFVCFLPKLQLISQSVWLICRRRQESRQRCLLECVTQCLLKHFLWSWYCGKKEIESGSLIDNDTRHHSGQNLFWTRLAVPRESTTTMMTHMVVDKSTDNDTPHSFWLSVC